MSSRTSWRWIALVVAACGVVTAVIGLRGGNAAAGWYLVGAGVVLWLGFRPRQTLLPASSRVLRAMAIFTLAWIAVVTSFALALAGVVDLSNRQWFVLPLLLVLYPVLLLSLYRDYRSWRPKSARESEPSRPAGE